MYSVTEEYLKAIASPVRQTAIDGYVRLKGGRMAGVSDGKIKEGSLRITSRMSRGGELRPGAAYASELAVTLLGFGDLSSSLDGAEIVLYFLLYTAGSTSDAERVPLGTFYIDGSTIKRSGGEVSLKAWDALVLFDRQASEMTDTLYNMVCQACENCGIAFGMTQEEFSALPNSSMTATLDTSWVQSWRDLLAHVGGITNSFAKITRDNKLLFVPLTCERDDKNMIITAREILGDVRFSTDFSDDATRIVKLVTMVKGKAYSSTVKYPQQDWKLAAMELPTNPLFVGLTDAEITAALDSEAAMLANCLNRAFSSSFNGDPALDVGDYVRLRGGSIDTERGYATGMITSQVWRYRGAHEIKCVLPLSVSAPAASAASVLAVDTADSDTDSSADNTPQLVPQKSQIEKQLDYLMKQAGQSPDTAKYLMSYGADAFPKLGWFGGYIGTLNSDGSYGSTQIYLNDFGVRSSNIEMTFEKGAAYSGGMLLLRVPKGEALTECEVNITDGSITLKNGLGYEMSVGNGNIRLYNSSGLLGTLGFGSDGLYYNGRRLKFADE